MALSYEARVKLEFTQLNEELRKLQARIQAISEQKLFKHAKAEIQEIQAQLNAAFAKIETESAMMQRKLGERVTRVSTLAGLGLPPTDASMRAATKRLTETVEASDLVKNTRELASTAQHSFVTMGQSAEKAEESVRKASRGVRDLSNNIIRNNSIVTTWWNNFGRVAIGFTIAYRTMNAFEALLGKVSSTLIEAVKGTGELATLQGKLAMFFKLGANSTMSFEEAYQRAAMNVGAVADASINAISSITELSTAMDELAQAGVVVPTRLAKEFVSFVDFTVLVAQTTGDNVRQIRSEISALMEGQTRANNQLIRLLKNFGVLTQQDIEDLRHMKNRAEAVEKVMKAIHEYWSKYLEKAIKSNPALAYEIWEKAIQRVLARSIELASKTSTNFNLFGETISKHIDAWKKMLSTDISKSIDVQRFATMFLLLNQALDATLTAFEKLLKGLSVLSTVIYNNKEQLKDMLKVLMAYEVLSVIGSVVDLIGSKISALYTWFEKFRASPKKLAEVLTILYSRFALIALGAVLAGVGVQSLIDVISKRIPTVNEATKRWSDRLSSLINIVRTFSHTLTLASMALIIFRGNLIAAGLAAAAGFAIDMAGLARSTMNISKAAEELKAAQEEYAKVNKQIIEANAKGDTALVRALEGRKELAFERVERAKAAYSAAKSVGESSGADFATAFTNNIKGISNTVLKTLQDTWNNISDWVSSKGMPQLDTSKFMPDMAEGLESMMKKPAEDMEELKKKYDKVTTDFYDSLITAVKEGNEKLANELAMPARYELEFRRSELQKEKTELDMLIGRRYDTLEKAMASNNEEIKKYALEREERIRQIAEIDKKLAELPGMPVISSQAALAREIEEDWNTIKETYQAGSQEFIDAAQDFLTYYQTRLQTIGPEFENEMSKEAFEKILKILKDAQNETGDWVAGVKKGLREVADTSYMKQFESFTVKVFDNLEDAIVDFAKSGKAAFADMVESMLADLLRLIVKMQVVKPVADLLLTSLPAVGAETGMTGIEATGGAFWENRLGFASGGWINERVVGIGLTSRRPYEFGESGPEHVSPGSPKTEINIYNNAPVEVQAKSTNEGGTQRIDVYIDEVVAAKLLSRSKSSTALRQAYGLNPILAGR